jgi:hypothetical protein
MNTNTIDKQSTYKIKKKLNYVPYVSMWFE